MKLRTVSLALCVAAGSASAQPTTPTDPPLGTEEVPPEPTPEPTPPPAPAPTPAPAPAPAPAVAMTQPVDDHRPTAFSVGIGLGYALPTSLEMPNITSVRFRLPSGLTFEPNLTLSSSSETLDTGTAVENSVTQFELGALARFPLVRRGRVDFEMLGGLSVANITADPEGEDNDTTTTIFTAAYGVAVASWITSHWQVSFSALNPIVTNRRLKEEMGPDTTTVTTTTTFGLIFDPTVILMVHLYH